VPTGIKEVIKMADKIRNYEEELAKIMNGLAESTLDLPENEIDEELRKEGDDPRLVAEEVRGVLRRAVKAHRQRHLIDAQKRYNERVLNLEKKEYSLPDSVEERQSLLIALLTNNPEIGSLLTAQNRDFTDLPDSEVTSYLNQLQELDVMVARPGHKDEEK
jgi:Fic family protein